ncbi:MAG TPA: hypothetical protein VGO59_13370 [Verrucomicrobiae bacterium]
MKNTTNTSFWLILAVVWLCQAGVMAQGQAEAQSEAAVFGNPLTNSFLMQSNDFEAEFGRLQGRFGTEYMGTTLSRQAGGRAPYSPTGPPLAQWGPLQFYPHALYEISYGDALPAQRGTNSTTLVNEFAPGMFLRLGSVWTLDYTPTLFFYSNPVFHNKTDEDVFLNGNTTNGNWVLSLSQRYLEVTQPLEETGTQPEQDAYITALGAVWQINAKSSLEFNVDQNFRFLDTAGLASSLYEWKTVDWFSYQFQPQLSGALGLGGGYDELSFSSDMPFEQVLGRVVFRPGPKLALTLMGGGEDRQFINPSAPSFVNPIFQAVALYQVRNGTLLSVSGSRTVVPSIYTGDVNVITAVTAGVRQHIVGNVQLEIEGSYTSEPFTSIQAQKAPAPLEVETSALATTRTDTRESLNVRLYTMFGTRLKASLFCLFVDNRSSSSSVTSAAQRGLNFSGVQGGVELEYKY